MGPTLARMAKRAAPGRRVIGVARFSAAGPARRAAAAWRRMHRGRPAVARGAGRAARRAQHRLHGGPQVRLDRQRMADLGDERPCAGAGGRALRALAHRRVLHRMRLSLRQHARARARRGRAAHRALGRIRELLRGARAHVPALLARATARRAACCACPMRSTCATACCTTWRGRSCSANRSTWRWATPTSSGRARPTTGRCARWPIAHADLAAQHQRTRRSASATWRRRWAQRLGIEPVLTGQRSADGLAGRLHARPSSCSARRRSSLDRMLDWTADWVSAAAPAWASPRTTKRATASTEERRRDALVRHPRRFAGACCARGS